MIAGIIWLVAIVWGVREFIIAPLMPDDYTNKEDRDENK
jgi:hypothetical protein